MLDSTSGRRSRRIICLPVVDHVIEVDLVTSNDISRPHNFLMVDHIVTRKTFPGVQSDVLTVSSTSLWSFIKRKFILWPSLFPHLAWLYLADFKEQVEVEVCAVISDEMSEEPLWVVFFKRQ